MATEQLQTATQAHYDQYPFIEGGPNRVAWWRDYLSDYLPETDIRDKLVVDVGSSVGEFARFEIQRPIAEVDAPHDLVVPGARETPIMALPARWSAE